MARTAKGTLDIYDDGVFIGSASSMDFEGAGVSGSFNSSNGRVTQTISGGGGSSSSSSSIAITGTVDGTNLVFTIAAGITASSLIIFDGTQFQIQGTDYNVSGTTLTFVSGHAPVVALTGFSVNSYFNLFNWTYGNSYALTSITRDINEAIITASVVWPDGSTGTFTTDTASTLFPGAIDAYHITYVNGSNTNTITQSLVTRDAAGAVIAQPVLTIV